MQHLEEYNICTIDINSLDDYIKLLIDSFNLYGDADYTCQNIHNDFARGNIFLGARLLCDNKLIGGICLEKKPIFQNNIYIENIFVHKNFRNMKVATGLINFIITNKENLFNLPNINLYLFCEEKLKCFYETNGFSVTDEYNDSSIKTLKMDRKLY